MGPDWVKQVYHNTVSLSVHGCIYLCVCVCLCMCYSIDFVYLKGENSNGILENVLLAVYDRLQDGLVINFTTQPIWNCKGVKVVICNIFNQSNS